MHRELLVDPWQARSNEGDTGISQLLRQLEPPRPESLDSARPLTPYTFEKRPVETGWVQEPLGFFALAWLRFSEKWLGFKSKKMLINEV